MICSCQKRVRKACLFIKLSLRLNDTLTIIDSKKVYWYLGLYQSVKNPGLKLEWRTNPSIASGVQKDWWSIQSLTTWVDLNDGKTEKIAVLGHKDWVEGINPHQPTIKPYCKQATFILVKMWKCPSLLLIHVHLSRSRIARCNRHMYVLLTTIIMVVMHFPGYIIKMTQALIFSRINCHALPCPLSLEQALCVFWAPEANALRWQWKIHTLHIYAFRLVLCNKPIYRIGFVKKNAISVL